MRRSSFRYLFSSFGFSNVADGFTVLMIPLIATASTKSPFMVSLVVLARTLPWAILAPLVGTMVDRLPAGRILVATSAGRFVLLSGYAAAAVSGHAGVGVLMAVAFTLGVLEIFYDVTVQSALPLIVAQRDLVGANAKLASTETVARDLAAPAVGGVIASWSLPGLVLVTAASYLGAGGLLTRLRFPTPAAAPHEPLRTQLVAGFRFIRRQPLLRRYLVMTVFGSAAFAGWFPLFTLYAVHTGPLHFGLRVFGIVMALAAVGGVVGGLLSGPLQRAYSTKRILLITTVISIVALAAPLFDNRGVGAISGLIAYSATVTIWNVITRTFRQQVSPADQIGRINASYAALVWGSSPLGALLAGAAGSLVSPRAGLLLMCGLLVVKLLFFIRLPVAAPAARADEREEGRCELIP